MSTKIYNAYRWSGTVETAFVFLTELRAKIETQTIETLQGYNYPKLMPEYKLVEEIQKAIKSGYNDPLNLSCSAVVYVYRHKVFIQFFGLDRSWEEKLARKKNLKDYSYWNNSDSEEGVSKRDWSRRGAVWEGIFKKSGYTPSRAGLTVELIGDSYTSIAAITGPVYRAIKAPVDQIQ